MSEIRWCDAGKHPFPIGHDKDEKEYAETREVNGKRARIDICGDCTRKSSIPLPATALDSTSTVVAG